MDFKVHFLIFSSVLRKCLEVAQNYIQPTQRFQGLYFHGNVKMNEHDIKKLHNRLKPISCEWVLGAPGHTINASPFSNSKNVLKVAPKWLREL